MSDWTPKSLIRKKDSISESYLANLNQEKQHDSHYVTETPSPNGTLRVLMIFLRLIAELVALSSINK